MTFNRKAFAFVCVLLTPMVLAMAMLLSVPQTEVDASSHREAPAISKDAFADNTDTYVWIPAGQTENIVLAASWIPFEGPEGGPNFWEWDENVEYVIYVSNDGDAQAEISYTLSSRVEIVNPNTFLYSTGPINSLTDDTWNRKQYITVTEYFEPGMQPSDGSRSAPTDHLMNIVANQLTAPNNVGSKSTPNYAALEAQAIHTYTDERNGDMVKVYAGQTDDPFWVDLQVFDLLTLRGQDSPIGYGEMETPVDSIAGFNNHSMIIEVPISRLTQGDETVLGVWATARRKQMDGTYTQVSRLGMPLVNEAVLPIALKDAFNSIRPEDDVVLYTDGFDAAFGGAAVGDLTQKSVEDPELGRLLCGLYGVPLPGDADDDCSSEVDLTTPRSGRADIFDIFLTGMTLANEFTINTAGGPAVLPAGFNVNQPAGVVPSEMIRVNTAISGDTCSPTPSRLGVLGGDACGFPNGRRPLDDVVEIELLAVAGAAYGVLTPNTEGFAFNADLIGVLTDGIDENDKPFRSEFPYFAMAQSGRTHVHTNESGMPTSLSFGNITIDSSGTPWLHLFAALASVGIVGSLEWYRRQRKA